MNEQGQPYLPLTTPFGSGGFKESCVSLIWVLFINFCSIISVRCSLFLGSNTGNREGLLVRKNVFVFDLGSEVSWPGAKLEEKRLKMWAQEGRDSRWEGKGKTTGSQSYLERNLKYEIVD